MADQGSSAATNNGRRRGSVAVKEHEFLVQPSEHHRKKMEEVEEQEGSLGKHLEPMFAGIAAVRDGDKINVGFSANDGTYTVDFTIKHLDGGSAKSDKEKQSKIVADFVIETMTQYQHMHFFKFLGAGVTEFVYNELSPELPSRIWAELDVVPMVFKPVFSYNEGDKEGARLEDRVDEQADSMARKAVMFFGPTMQPRVGVGWRNQVGVDADGHAILTTIEDYKKTCGEATWNAVMKYIKDVKGRKVKIAFFNSTPQGGGVALMRHALVRFLRLFDVQIAWYVPKPRPEVFRITKTNHNILQGVNDPGEELSKEQGDLVSEWIQDNAHRYWLRDGGPLCARSQGGADVVFIDDPQMPGLIPLAKKADPERQVLFRSHIQIRSDLTDKEGTAAHGVWQYLWKDIKEADLFIAHPVKSFVPKDVPDEKVGYMPACTDWLDGLNKELNPWAWGYHVHNYNVDAESKKKVKINYPCRRYIIQVARFDPSKGIHHLVHSYAILRRKYFKDKPVEDTPQLVICGHGAIDDPDATRIYDETEQLLEQKYSDIKACVSVVRLGPIDQQLNALLSSAQLACQLSTREGFEVKVSEALHKGVPVIASKAGGIPLQVHHEKNGFHVDPEDHEEVAARMNQLLTDAELRKRFSEYARRSVSDEIGTVGNALSWLFLASAMSKGEKVEPNWRWINDMAREQAGEPYREGETRLPRHETT